MTAPWTPLAAAPHAIDCTVRYQGPALGAIDGTNMGLTLYTTIKIEENNSTMATNGSVDTDMGQGLALYTAPSKSIYPWTVTDMGLSMINIISFFTLPTCGSS